MAVPADYFAVVAMIGWRTEKPHWGQEIATLWRGGSFTADELLRLTVS